MAATRYWLGCEIVTASPDGKPVVSMGGLKVTPDIDFDASMRSNSTRWSFPVVMPGKRAWRLISPTWSAAFTRTARSWAASAQRRARCGDRRAERDWPHRNQLESHQQYPEYKGASRYRNQPKAVSDGRVVTRPAPRRSVLPSKSEGAQPLGTGGGDGAGRLFGGASLRSVVLPPDRKARARSRLLMWKLAPAKEPRS